MPRTHAHARSCLCPKYLQGRSMHASFSSSNLLVWNDSAAQVSRCLVVSGVGLACHVG